MIIIFRGGFLYNLQNVLPIYSKCGQFGWKFLENCQYVMHDFSYFKEDKVHPNEIGSKAIASAMYSALNGNCGVHKNWTSITLTNKHTNIQAISGGSGTMKLDNEIITMISNSDAGGMKVAFTEQTITKNTFFPIFDISNGYHIPDQYRPIKHNTIIYTDSSYSNYVEGQIVLLNGQYGIIPFKDITTNFIIIPQQNIKFNCMIG